MQRNSLKILGTMALFLFLLSLTGYAGDDKNKGHGLDLKNIDNTVKPSEDFFQYSVGGWVKNNPIPDEFSRWGSFEMLREENLKVLKSIVDKTAALPNKKKDSPEQKIGDFFTSGMDSAKIEAAGYTPIKTELSEIDHLKSKFDLMSLISKMHARGQRPLFFFYVDLDDKNSEVMAAQLSQGGTGLPDIEYYTRTDARSKEIREHYLTHVIKMFTLTGASQKDAEKYAQIIMDIETKLAQNSFTRVENRDPDKTYNKMTVDELNKLAQGFNWNLYFRTLVTHNPDYVIIGQPKFFKAMGELINKTSLSDFKVYLKWNVINRSASELSSAFVNEDYDFYSAYLNGTKAMRPRWKRVLAAVNGTMGELLGQLYVAEVFPPKAKERAKAIVDNLLVSMGESIQKATWMGDDTKKAAMLKLSKFGVKIGYPDKWKDYSALHIGSDSYYQNVRNAAIWASHRNLEKLGKPVDRTEWGMSPQTVNAYYSPNRNEIVFPAAILQPPFFTQDADDAVNYGAMGAVIGHEISHGFDDQGRKFDADGNLKDWWTKDDADKFQTRAAKLTDQYNHLVVTDTFKVNGALTLGENLGDLGGLNISFNAFKKTAQFAKGEKIDGFTPQQRFFLSWGQIWAENNRLEGLKLRLKTDVHSPGKQRVIGPLRNMPEFFDAFDVKPGDKMRMPDDQLVKVW